MQGEHFEGWQNDGEDEQLWERCRDEGKQKEDKWKKMKKETEKGKPKEKEKENRMQSVELVELVQGENHLELGQEREK